MTEEVSMTETTASASSLMQIDNNTDTPHTADVWLGSLYTAVRDLPSYSQMTLEQLLEHLAEMGTDGVWVFAFGRETPFYGPIDPAQLTDAVWETIDTVRIGPVLVGGSKAHKEETE